MFYQSHIFCCTNRRPDGHKRGSCAASGSEQLRNYMKDRAKELGIKGSRVNSAGCLDRCELGPVFVIYPEGIWYTAKTKEDVDAILERHVMKGEIVKHLQLHDDQLKPSKEAS
jgi:(2Fe-2S) ferredoxin